MEKIPTPITLTIDNTTTTVRGGQVKVRLWAVPMMLRKIVIHRGKRAELCVMGRPDGKIDVFINRTQVMSYTVLLSPQKSTT